MACLRQSLPASTVWRALVRGQARATVTRMGRGVDSAPRRVGRLEEEHEMLVKPEEVGLSSSRLGRITDHLQRYIDAGKLAGTLTLVARRGKIAYFEPQGHLEIERTRPVTVDAAYRKLGVGNRTRAGYTLRDMIDELAALPLEFSPGTRWNYSVSTDVVGYLIEVISGQRLDAYLREHVLQPLGMTDTSFVIGAEQVERFAANYQRQADDGLKLIDDPARSIYRDCVFFSGGGGLVSTAPDYFRLTTMLLNQGELDGVRVLGRKTVELMTLNHLADGQDLTTLALPGMFTETAYGGVGFGLGFSVMQSPARAQISGTPGEFAWGGAAGTAFWVDPVEQMIVVFMTQIMQMGLPSPYPIRRELRTLTYSAVIE